MSTRTALARLAAGRPSTALSSRRATILNLGRRRLTCTSCLASGASSSSPLDIDTTKRSSGASTPVGEMPLGEIVRKTIDATGPMPLARYMTLCLSHPTQGYYTARGADVFGKEGDFITSPEISQTFGELMAIWFITRWQANGSPAKVRLVELGPGRGTLMADVLRTLNSFPEVADGIESINLVETSDVLRAVQSAALSKAGAGRPGRLSPPVRHWDVVEQIPQSDAFTFFIAHEFFDALPIHILERIPPTPAVEELESSAAAETPADAPPVDDKPAAPRFRELLLTHTPPSSTLHLTLSPKPTNHSSYLPTTSPHFSTVKEGERVEISPQAFSIMHRLGALVGPGSGGGAGLVVDYGKDGWASESFRAFKDHAAVSPFDHVGTADLTTNVDFAYLRHALSTLPEPPQAAGPMTQADWLEAMGLSIRLAELLKLPSLQADSKRREELEGACERLVDRNGMGSEYLFLGIESPAGGKRAPGTEEPKIYPFHGLM